MNDGPLNSIRTNVKKGQSYTEKSTFMHLKGHDYNVIKCPANIRDAEIHAVT